MLPETVSQATHTLSTKPTGEQVRGAIWLRRAGPLTILFAAFLLQWALLMNISGPTWDAAFYYSYGRSLVYDRDLSLSNDLQLSYPTASADFVARELHNERTPTGSVHAPFAIGSGLFWAPFLAIMRLAAQIIGLPASTGFEWYLVGPIATLGALSGLLAYILCYHAAARYAGRGVALLTTLTMTFATPLIYYQFREPLYAHIPSALFNTLFLLTWLRFYRRIPSSRQSLALGVLLGLSSLMRWQNAIYVVLPLVSIPLAWLQEGPENRRQAIPAVVKSLSVMAIASIAVFSLQLFVWQAHYGSWFTIPQGSSFMTWRLPFLRELLLSPFRGILPWMPVFGLALVGLFLQVRQNPRLVIPLLLLILVSIYVNASSRDWFAGGGYGPRRSTGELAILVLGFAWLLVKFPRRLRLPFGFGAGLVLALHQWLLLRFALVERIGGRVLSMAPTFEWAESSFAEFSLQLFAHVPDVFRQPLDTFVFPGSPLFHVLRTRTLPRMHLYSLIAVAAFFLISYVLFEGAIERHGLRRLLPAALAGNKRKRPEH